MRDFVAVFVMCTVLQVAFCVLYYLLTGMISATILIGFALYIVSAIALYFGYRHLARKKEKQDLLDALP